MLRIAKLFPLLALVWSDFVFGQASVGGNAYIPSILTNVNSPANNQCLVYQSSSQRWVNGSCASGGGATVTGSPASGNLAKWSGAGTLTNVDLTGDCTTSGSNAVTCTKSSGVALAPAALAYSSGSYAITAAETAAGFTPTSTQLSYEPYDLRRYGGVGDGVTDNTTAINTWISVCQQSSAPGSCFIFPGTYLTTGNHTITKAFNILGRGGGEYSTAGPLIKLSANATNIINWNGLNNSGPQMTGVLIEGVTFDGGSFAVSDAALAFQGMTMLTVRDSGVHHLTGVGVRLRQTWDSQFDNVMIRSVDAHSANGVLVIDSIYNSDVNQNVNNFSLRRCHLENNQGTYIYAASNSNLFLLRADDTKFEVGSGSPTGGPFPLFNILQGNSVLIYDNQFDGFTAAAGYDRMFKLGDTTAATGVLPYNIYGNIIHGISASTYYVDTESSTSGVFERNQQDNNTTGLVSNASSRAVRFEYPQKTGVQADGQQVWSRAQDALTGFVGLDRLQNSGPTSFTQNSNSNSASQSVIVSPASASSILVSLPMPAFTGMQGSLKIGVRCFSATGVGNIQLHYNTTTTTPVACPATTFGTITFDIPQSALSVLSTSGSNRFRLETGSTNTEAVTVDGVYFQSVPASTVDNFTFGSTSFWNQSGAGTNLGTWGCAPASGVFTCATYTDALGAGLNFLTATRGTTTNVSDVSLGNATSNPTYHFLGTGTITFPSGGTLTGGNTLTLGTGNVSTGRFTVTGTTGPTNGMFQRATNTVAFTSNSTFRGMWDAVGNFIPWQGTTATTDTDGFLYLPSVAGVPTGVPNNLTGDYANNVPVRYDTTDQRLYVYSGGAWNTPAPTGTFTVAPAANTVVDSLLLQDLTAAGSSSNNQYSGALHFIGQGWKTNATAGSQQTEWRIYNRPASGSASPNNALAFDRQINSGGFVDGLVMANNAFTFGNSTDNPSYTFAGTGTITFPSGATLSGGGTFLLGSGSITAARYTVSGSTIPANGIYNPATNQLGFASNTTLRGYFDANGLLNLNNAVISAGTKFTTSGCSVSSTTGGATAGVFTLGANSCTVVITMAGATGATATNGWTCEAHDKTAPTVLIGGESSSTTTTASITIPAGAGATDVISFSCTGY